MNERRLLLTVDEAFHISGRGCLLTPGLPVEGAPPIQRGDELQLQLPDGRTAATVIHSIDAVHNRKTDAPEIRFFLTLPRKVSKEDVPRGTQVYWRPSGSSE